MGQLLIGLKQLKYNKFPNLSKLHFLIIFSLTLILKSYQKNETVIFSIKYLSWKRSIVIRPNLEKKQGKKPDPKQNKMQIEFLERNQSRNQSNLTYSSRFVCAWESKTMQIISQITICDVIIASIENFIITIKSKWMN